MLSDRHRLPKILLLLASLVALCGWYAWQASHHTVGFARCMEDPAAHDGQLVELALWRVEDVQPGLYHIGGLTRGVPVRGPTESLEPGLTISVIGRFDAEQLTLVEQWREIHPSRTHKNALGLVGLAGFIAFAAANFTWRERRLVLRA